MRLPTWLFIITLPVLFKIWPNVSHYNPQIVFAVYLAARISKPWAVLSVLLSAILSDLASSYVLQYGAFGDWTVFTYSALLLITLTSSKKAFLGYTLIASLGFWLWTNFGVWLTGHSYEHTGQGLFACYTAALPFLEYSLLAALLWGSLLQLTKKGEEASPIKIN